MKWDRRLVGCLVSSSGYFPSKVTKKSTRGSADHFSCWNGTSTLSVSYVGLLKLWIGDTVTETENTEANHFKQYTLEQIEALLQVALPCLALPTSHFSQKVQVVEWVLPPSARWDDWRIRQPSDHTYDSLLCSIMMWCSKSCKVSLEFSCDPEQIELLSVHIQPPQSWFCYLIWWMTLSFLCKWIGLVRECKSWYPVSSPLPNALCDWPCKLTYSIWWGCGHPHT